MGDIFARKSPRGHASTKSYLVNTNGSINVDDDEAFEHILYHGIAVDECSNDSVMSSFSNKKAGGGSGPKCESIGQLIEIANRLDAFFAKKIPYLYHLPQNKIKIIKRNAQEDAVRRVKRHHNNKTVVDPNEDPKIRSMTIMHHPLQILIIQIVMSVMEWIE